MGRNPVSVCHLATTSGWLMKRKNSATALYSSGLRFGAVMTQKLAPPMMEFFGAPAVPGQ